MNIVKILFLFGFFVFGLVFAYADDKLTDLANASNLSYLDDRSSAVCQVPFVSGITNHNHHAYVGVSLANQGSLLKYHAPNGVPAVVHGSDILPDLWGDTRSSSLERQGTWHQLGRQNAHRLVVPMNGHDNDKRLAVIDQNQWQNHQDVSEKLRQLGVLNEQYQLPPNVGTIAYPASISERFGVLGYTSGRGVFRVVGLDGGRQLMAFLPRIADDFGSDGRWSLYEVRFGNKVRLLAVGGFGRYAKGLSVLDLTDVPTGGQPRLLYRIGAVSGFERVGHIYAKPSLAYVYQGGERMPVFVFGGGLDDCYFGGQCHDVDDGAVVYVIHAMTGQKLGEWHQYNADNRLRYSMAGELSVLDRQGDGVFDHVYVADMGGQLWRFDVGWQMAQLRQSVRLFVANDGVDVPNKRLGNNAVRFSQKPLISFYHRNHYPAYAGSSKRFAVVAIASNNAKDGATPNHLYAIFDDGVFNDNTSSRNITPSQLQKINDNAPTNAMFLSVARAKGWYKELDIKGDKKVSPVGEMVAFGTVGLLKKQGVESQLYLTLMNDKVCPPISQTQSYCLPFGVCAHRQTGRLVSGASLTSSTSAIMQGIYTPTLVKVTNAQGISQLRLLGVNAISLFDSMQQGNHHTDNSTPKPSDVSADGVSEGVLQLTRRLSPSRWYDVRHVGNDE